MSLMRHQLKWRIRPWLPKPLCWLKWEFPSIYVAMRLPECREASGLCLAENVFETNSFRTMKSLRALWVTSQSKNKENNVMQNLRNDNKEKTITQNLWNDDEYRALPDLGGLVYRSNLLGRDRTVANIFGGNTSAKLELPDFAGRN